jgi:hypothetical protein
MHPSCCRNQCTIFGKSYSSEIASTGRRKAKLQTFTMRVRVKGKKA